MATAEPLDTTWEVPDALWEIIEPILLEDAPPKRTGRGKAGTKKSLIVEAQGGPLGAVIAGANVPDCKLLDHTIEAIVIDRPDVTEGAPQHLCLDKGFDNPSGRDAAELHGYTPH